MAGYGDTFFFGDENDAYAHLHVIITEPTTSGDVITVSVTTRRKKSDAIVPLEVGDHPYIRWPSVIAFAYAKVMNIAKINELIEQRDAKQREPMDEKILRRARNALTESEQTPYEVLEFYRHLAK